MNSTDDHYAILGVRRDASNTAIRAAYLAQIKAHHPDMSRDRGRADRIVMLQSAYACLRDPVLRAIYDRHVIAAELSSRRKVRRAWRRLQKFDRRSSSGIAFDMRHIATVGVIAGGMLLASALYLIDL